MCAKLLGFLLFACQIILNGSDVIRETTDDAINVTSTPAPAPSTLPEGYVRFPDVHAAYKVHKERVTWVQARDLCIAEGAHLAITDTVKKLEHIEDLTGYRDRSMRAFTANVAHLLGIIGDTHPAYTRFEFNDWISVGIQKSNTTDDWIRVDNGLPLTSIPWSKNNPDDVGTCVAISFSGNSLLNFFCDAWPAWYVCEIPI